MSIEVPPPSQDPMIPERPNAALSDISGRHAFWDDGVDTFVMAFPSGTIPWYLVDTADDALRALLAIRERPDEMTDTEIRTGLDAAARLQKMGTAIADELILIARERETPLGWGFIGEALDMHRSTVRERWTALVSQSTAAVRATWAHWLTQGTPRARLYGRKGRYDKPEES